MHLFVAAYVGKHLHFTCKFCAHVDGGSAHSQTLLHEPFVTSVRRQTHHVSRSPYTFKVLFCTHPRVFCCVCVFMHALWLETQAGVYFFGHESGKRAPRNSHSRRQSHRHRRRASVGRRKTSRCRHRLLFGDACRGSGACRRSACGATRVQRSSCHRSRQKSGANRRDAAADAAATHAANRRAAFAFAANGGGWRRSLAAGNRRRKQRRGGGRGDAIHSPKTAFIFGRKRRADRRLRSRRRSASFLGARRNRRRRAKSNRRKAQDAAGCVQAAVMNLIFMLPNWQLFKRFMQQKHCFFECFACFLLQRRNAPKKKK